MTPLAPTAYLGRWYRACRLHSFSPGSSWPCRGHGEDDHDMVREARQTYAQMRPRPQRDRGCEADQPVRVPASPRRARNRLSTVDAPTDPRVGLDAARIASDLDQ